jgi:hypothetical protein
MDSTDQLAVDGAKLAIASVGPGREQTIFLP